MALDDQVRKNADALAKELGLDIQQAFGRFLDDVLAQVTNDQDALQAQADQAVADAEARADAAQAAVAEAQAEAEAQKTQASRRPRKSRPRRSRRRSPRRASTSPARRPGWWRGRARKRRKPTRRSRPIARRAGRVDEEAAALRAAAEQGSLAAMERLLDAFRRLDQATTLTALIDTPGRSGRRRDDALGRVRRPRARGARLARGRLQRRAGRRPAGQRLARRRRRDRRVRALEGPGRDLARDASPTPASSAFIAAADAASGLAMPVTLGGETAAVIYGDDGGAGGPAGWRETIEILARHASRCLEAQTAIRAAKLGARIAEGTGRRRALGADVAAAPHADT